MADEKTREDIGTAPVIFTGKSLYFISDGGTFEQGDIKGRFAPTVGGAAVVVYIDGGGSYECRTEDIVKAAIEHHRKMKL